VLFLLLCVNAATTTTTNNSVLLLRTRWEIFWFIYYRIKKIRVETETYVAYFHPSTDLLFSAWCLEFFLAIFIFFSSHIRRFAYRFVKMNIYYNWHIIWMLYWEWRVYIFYYFILNKNAWKWFFVWWKLDMGSLKILFYFSFFALSIKFCSHLLLHNKWEKKDFFW
jgi:hypothetical protein